MTQYQISNSVDKNNLQKVGARTVDLVQPQVQNNIVISLWPDSWEKSVSDTQRKQMRGVATS